MIKLLLNDRKLKILEAIITDYIENAEPIGSRTIAKKYNLGISPATIRNEMSDLEELGLIEQPHTSAGRIPSDKGYRLYVDNMMRSRELTGEETEFLKNAISFNVGQIDYIMQQTARALAMLTNYTTVITEPTSKKTVLKKIQLVSLDEQSVVAVIITEDKTVKNTVIRSTDVPEGDRLTKINARINSVITGVELEAIDKDNVARLLTDFPENRAFVTEVLKVAFKTVKSSENLRLYTSGAKNLLGFPEFSDIEKAKGIFRALDEKDLLITVLGDDNDSRDSVKIQIGDENNMEELKNCSIVKANYKVGNSSFGRIGIIGPTRMNYSQTVSVLSSIIRRINHIMADMEDGDNDE